VFRTDIWLARYWLTLVRKHIQSMQSSSW